jgi:hypothetical protein
LDNRLLGHVTFLCSLSLNSLDNMEVPISQHQHSTCSHDLDPKAHKDNKEPSKTIGNLSISTSVEEMNPTELSFFTSQEETLQPSKPSDSYDDRYLQPELVRSFGDALDASRGMSARSQSTTPHSLYSAQGRGSAGSIDSYGFPASHSTSSSLSSSSNYWSYSGGSINSSVSDYSNINSNIKPVLSRTQPRPLGLPSRGISPEPKSMFGRFRLSNPKLTLITGKHKCKLCDKRFTRPSSLQTHMYSHTGAKRKLSCLGTLFGFYTNYE